MKRCPKCHRAYEDETLRFCLEDGSPLFDARDSEAPATEILPARSTPTLKSTGPTVPSYQASADLRRKHRTAKFKSNFDRRGNCDRLIASRARRDCGSICFSTEPRKGARSCSHRHTVNSPSAGTRTGVVDRDETLIRRRSNGTPLKITARRHPFASPCKRTLTTLRMQSTESGRPPGLKARTAPASASGFASILIVRLPFTAFFGSLATSRVPRSGTRIIASRR